MECGSWCVYYTSMGVGGACTNCSAHVRERKTRFEFGEVNPFELAQKLAEKREQERRNKILQLSNCPDCHKHSLFYNKLDDSFACLALECEHSIKKGTMEYKAILFLANQEQQQ